MKRSGLLMIVAVVLLFAFQVEAGKRGRDNPSTVPQTGQKIAYHLGDDGDIQAGVPWVPQARFIDNGNGTVTDTLTNLMWTKDAQGFENGMLWPDAIVACNDLDIYGYNDWRLPNLRELLSLADYGNYSPALPIGHPFINVQFYFSWSSTTNPDPGYPNNSWGVSFYDGRMLSAGHEYHFFVWCVRGGN